MNGFEYYALGLELEIIHIREFEAPSESAMQKLCEYFLKVKNLDEVLHLTLKICSFCDELCNSLKNHDHYSILSIAFSVSG